MAKNIKTKNKSNGKAMSSTQFFRERAREFPLAKCYLSSPSLMCHEACAVVTRRRSNGNLIAASFVIDPMCRGVIACEMITSANPEEIEKWIKSLETMSETDYATVHNYILGAEEFAAEGGLEPCASYKTASCILEEDSDDIEITEFDFGFNGVHALIDCGQPNYRAIRSKLVDTLGLKNFIEIDRSAIDGITDSADNEEPYFHVAEYPVAIDNKTASLLAKLTDKKLEKSDIDELSRLPRAEFAETLRTAVAFQTGIQARSDDEEEEDEEEANENAKAWSQLMVNAVALAIELKSPELQPMVTDMMKMPEWLTDDAFGENTSACLISALVHTTDSSNLCELGTLAATPGIEVFRRVDTFGALEDLELKHSEMRPEIISILNSALSFYKSYLEEGKGSPVGAAFLASVVETMAEPSLLEPLETLFATGRITTSICGEFDEIKANILQPEPGVESGIETLNTAEEVFDLFA